MVTTNGNKITAERTRILVLDEDKDIHYLLNRTLVKEGFDTVVAVDMEEGMQAIADLHPDLVVLDSSLTDLESMQNLTSIRSVSDVPIVFISSQGGMDALREAMSRGADDFVTKPIKKLSFVARIRAKIRRYRMKPRY